MNRLSATLFLSTITMTATASSSPLPASDTPRIQALYDHFANAFRNCDVDGVMSFYVHDRSLFAFDLTPPSEHTGWDDYRNNRREFFLEMKPPIGFTINGLQIRTSGDVAYTHSVQQVNAPIVNGGSLRLRLRVTDVLRKIDGRWLIVEEHVSVPIDLATGAAVLSDP